MVSHTTRNHIVDRVRRLFGGMPCRVQVAALPWRRSGMGVEIMLITSRDTGRWVLPKGWPEGQEDLCDAAGREAAEEAGLSGTVSRLEIGRYYYGKRQPSGLESRCEVLVFPMEIDHVAKNWPEKTERKRQWFSPQAAAAQVKEPDLAELIAAFSVEAATPALVMAKS
jgi:8-oxo-dGTP pyrophosphatase MutT (NUDIX family)